MTDNVPRTYPPGVTCWVDTVQPDLAAARAFYAELFGWAFTDVMPPGASGSYLIASRHGNDVAAIGPGSGEAAWHTYVAVGDADAAARAVTEAGGQVLAPPADAGPGGRAATCADPGGVPFRLWQARRRLGAQLVNAPGAWNFSHLRAGDVASAKEFYAAVFGWAYDDIPGMAGASIRVPGYGRHLAQTSDPGIYERQAGAPEGFADVIGAVQPAGARAPAWHVVFSVADRDAAADTVRRLGGTVHGTDDGQWARQAEVSDPQGARFTVSQFTPPS